MIITLQVIAYGVLAHISLQVSFPLASVYGPPSNFLVARIRWTSAATQVLEDGFKKLVSRLTGRCCTTVLMFFSSLARFLYACPSKFPSSLYGEALPREVCGCRMGDK